MDDNHGATRPCFTVNGQNVEVQAKNMTELLAALGVDPATVVAEVNGTILPQDEWSTHALADGDVIELVRFVGGG